jgi:hypothetical protein
MSATPYAALLPATPDAPTEVCLTLYYDRPASAAALAPAVRAHLAAAVAAWELVEFEAEAAGAAERRGLYEAQQPPANFLSLYLRAFASPHSLHTEVVQLILSSAEAYDTAWPQAATWLADHLAAWLRPDQTSFLGYTLVYRANTSPNPAGPAPTPEVLAAVRVINGAVPQPVPPQVLAWQPQADQGWLLLLKYPQGPAQGLIYLALGMGQQPDELASAAYFGPRAALPAQDVFVHKALQQSYLVSRDYDNYEAQSLKSFKDSITKLLRIVDNPQEKNVWLDDLAQRLADLTHTNWDLNRLQYSLQQQLNGIERQFATAEMPAIARRHLATILSHWQEIHALVAQHQLVLENARVAISLVEAQENKHTTTLQKQFGQLVAVGGIFLGAYSAIDIPLVQAATTPVLPWYWLYAFRFGAAAMLTALLVTVYWLIRYFTKKKRAKRATHRGLLLNGATPTQ